MKGALKILIVLFCGICFLANIYKLKTMNYQPGEVLC